MKGARMVQRTLAGNGLFQRKPNWLGGVVGSLIDNDSFGDGIGWVLNAQGIDNGSSVVQGQH